MCGTDRPFLRIKAMTFSILAFDREQDLIGSAVASKWTGVGGCTQFFRPGTGLVNIQNHSYAQVAYRILDNIETGMALSDSLAQALSGDNAREKRQCLLADLHGHFHAASGAACSGIFRHKVSVNCAAAGNTLAKPDVVDAMIDAYESSASNVMTERLLDALEAGQAAGGDSRGQEAAAIKVYKTTYPVQRFYPIDLRADSHDAPLEELRRLYTIFGENDRRVEF
ncbi:MAG: DUF1028 domain-containing protein [Proteobacteria bacterium]|nr:DUF1028 domain-containing protein [Pseudomonadota bacterium]